MHNGIDIGVVGAAVLAPQNARHRALEEAIYEVARAAVRDAGLVTDDIEGIAVAGNDQLDGRAISIMAASGSVGGVGREILSTPSAAEHAFVLGALRIGSGQFRNQLVVGWSPTEVDSITGALHLATDPYYHRALPLSPLSASALQASALESRDPDARALAVEVVGQNRRNGAIAYPERLGDPVEDVWIRGGRPLAWPLTDSMVAKPAFGLTALVLAERGYVDERGLAAPAWIRGIGWATESGFLGDRDLVALPSLGAAARRAYAAAGVGDPATAFDVAEVADATPYEQLLALDALGLGGTAGRTARLRAGDFAPDGALPVNLSGGALSFNPFFCAGLLRIVEAANQVRGCAGRHQRRGVRRAVAHAASGYAMQYNTVVVLAADREGALQ